jgi:phage anti-repressor protein/phage antirepressor YoqD-like protein
MNAIIAITSRPVNGQEIPTVNARELHGFLGLSRDFNQWMREQIERARLKEGRDYLSYEDVVNPMGGRPRKEYAITLDATKHISMMSGSDKGFEVRDYFIECERRAKNPIAIPQTLPEALRLAAQLAEEKETAMQKAAQLEAKVEEQAPKVAALDRIEASPEHLTLTQAAKKVLGVKRDALTVRLHREQWIYRQNGSWLPYRPKIEQRLLIYKEARYTDETTGMECIKPYCHITQKGMTKLAEMLGGFPF